MSLRFRRRVEISLSDDELARVDKIAIQRNLPRSKVIADFINNPNRPIVPNSKISIQLLRTRGFLSRVHANIAGQNPDLGDEVKDQIGQIAATVLDEKSRS